MVPIVNAKTKESLDYGKLTQGRKLTKTVAVDVTTISPADWTIAGQSAAKVDGREFVTGKHAYSSDIRLPGMWHGKVLRPPSFGATLVSIDASAAKSMPDVVVCQDGDFVGVAASSEVSSGRARSMRSKPNGRPVRQSPARTCSRT